MATIDLRKQDGVIHAKISGALRAADFETIEPAVDKILKQDNRPDGVLLEAENFEGWEDFSAFVRHMEFIRDHHQYVKKVAIEGAGKGQEMLQRIASMVSGVEVKIFDFGQGSEAESWLKSDQ